MQSKLCLAKRKVNYSYDFIFFKTVFFFLVFFFFNYIWILVEFLLGLIVCFLFGFFFRKCSFIFEFSVITQ